MTDYDDPGVSVGMRVRLVDADHPVASRLRGVVTDICFPLGQVSVKWLNHHRKDYGALPYDFGRLVEVDVIEQLGGLA
jgi:hypothetical protein